MEERLRPVLVRKNSFGSRLRRFVGQRNFTLERQLADQGDSLLQFTKDSGGGEICGEGLELDNSQAIRQERVSKRALPARGEKCSLGRQPDRTSTYFSMMITGNPVFDSWRARSSAALRLEKVPN